MTRNAFTLVETLAVVVVLALGAGLTLATLPSWSAGAQRRHAHTTLDSALRTAVLRAESAGGCTLHLDAGALLLTEHDGAARNEPRRSRSFPLPSGWSCRIDGVHSLDDALIFDGAGRSADALISLRSTRADELAFRWLGIAGTLTPVPPGTDSLR